MVNLLGWDVLLMHTLVCVLKYDEIEIELAEGDVISTNLTRL